MAWIRFIKNLIFRISFKITFIKYFKSLIPYKFKTIYKKNFRKFHGLKKLDEKMLRYINFNNGYFVEIGAHDGVQNSNTLYYEKYKKWHGLLIEPSDYFNYLVKNRSKKNKFFNCGCSRFDSINETNLKGSGDFSVCVDLVDKKFFERSILKQTQSNFKIAEKKIKLRTLNSILIESKSPNIIDFFSLDVEGMELDVLKGIDFNFYNFKYLLVECANKERKEIILNFLKSKNYDQIEDLTPWDILFKYQN